MLYCVNWTDPVEKKRRAPGTLIREEKYPNIAFKSLQEWWRGFSLVNKDLLMWVTYGIVSLSLSIYI